MTRRQQRVVVLGASGMLGSMVVDYLARQPLLEVGATVRSKGLLDSLARRVRGVRWTILDAEQTSVQGLVDLLDGASWAINALGVIKPYIHDDNPTEVERAVIVNALFPYRLGRAAEEVGCHVIQIATDCVFSGRRGRYVESDEHDPLDAYGKTKSLGEVRSPSVCHLRCSIVGPEPKAHVSLLDWFIGQRHGARVNGFTNHQWNGITTLHFAKLCLGVITGNLPIGHVQHVLPADTVSKAELLRYFADAYGRTDIAIVPVEAKVPLDRTLATEDQPLNRRLWQAAGYENPPTIPEMIGEMARFDYRCGGL